MRATSPDNVGYTICRNVRPATSGARYNGGGLDICGIGWSAVAQAVTQGDGLSAAETGADASKKEDRTAPHTTARERLVIATD
ncbi:hypothetical protein PPGU16_30090 [Paraburkholderia largidicola]|uniref:Uncharacterized protein n=1 Tax=Paraburkholderia largidicola TaxID=3014751 RepID=A0A7I8BMT1_9BURK|nr:hypothetical protein PPGU16_30090 [Paraburkholderia sp. PGU16]